LTGTRKPLQESFDVSGIDAFRDQRQVPLVHVVNAQDAREAGDNSRLIIGGNVQAISKALGPQAHDLFTWTHAESRHNPK
jgi:hypothetical protein